MKSTLRRMALLSSFAFLFGRSLTPMFAQTADVSMKKEQSSLSVANKTGVATIKVPLSPADPVITIHGLCGETQHSSSAKSSPCETQVSKQEFESLIGAVDFQGQLIEPAVRKQFAQTYADLLLFEQACKGAGLAETPQFKLILRWLSLRTMADMYYHMVQEKNRVPTPAEIEAYYKTHLSSFESVRLTRILIPREDFAMQDKNGEFDLKAQNTARMAHDRALKGDNPDQIQKDVYAALGLTSVTPTDMGIKRREDFLASEAEDVFRLVPGEVTQVEKEPRNYVIYKVVSKNIPKEAQVRDQISKKIADERTSAAIQAVKDSAKIDLNAQYFGPTPPQPSAAIGPASARH